MTTLFSKMQLNYIFCSICAKFLFLMTLIWKQQKLITNHQNIQVNALCWDRSQLLLQHCFWCIVPGEIFLETKAVILSHAQDWHFLFKTLTLVSIIVSMLRPDVVFSITIFMFIDLIDKVMFSFPDYLSVYFLTLIYYCILSKYALVGQECIV